MTTPDDEVVLETVQIGASVAVYRFRFRRTKIDVEIDAEIWRADSGGALSMAVECAVERALAVRAATGAT